MFGRLRAILRSKPAAPELAPAATSGLVPFHGDVDENRVRAALAAAGSGGWDAADQLWTMLLAVDQSGDVDMGSRALDLLSAAVPSVWKGLDLAARRRWWHYPEWDRAARARLSLGNPGVLALVIASFHPDGYVREAAVAGLGEVGDPAAVQALALRAADWVPEVRDRARAALVRVPTSVESLLLIGPLAVMLADREQGDWLSAYLSQSIARLEDSDLRQLLAARDWHLRRVAYLIALRDRRLRRADLMDAAAHDGDLVIRVQCAEQAISEAVAADEVGEVRSLIDSGTAAVRATALSALVGAGRLDVAETALADSNSMVRAIAQAAVRRSGADPADRYRNIIITTDPPDPAAIAGLGETGSKADAALISRSLRHPVPRGRLEAVRALRRLGAVDLPTLIGMIEDPSPAVTRQVAGTLAPFVHRIDTARLSPLAISPQPRHVRMAALRLLRGKDVWTRLLADLELYDDPDDAIRNRAQGDLLGWLNNEAATAYVTPVGETAQRCEELLQRAAGSIDPHRIQLLRFYLGLPETAG